MRKIIGTMAGFLALAPMAVAEEAPMAVLHLNTLKYTSGTEKTGTTSESVSSLKTASLADSWLMFVTKTGQSIYFLPFSDQKAVALGQFLNPALEVGVDIGLNNSKRGSNKESQNVFGAFVHYTLGMGAHSVELVGSFDMFSKATETTVGTTTTKTDLGLNIIAAEAYYVVPLSSNFSYVGGARYRITSGEEKESKTDISNSELDLTLAALRVRI
jgi:hypothetical protein